MDSTNTKVSLLEGQSSKLTKPQEPRIIIVFFSFIILVALLIGAITTAQFVKISNPINPYGSVGAICSVTQYRYSCFKTLSSITKNTTTTPIQTHPELSFTLFLQLAIQELTNLISLPKTQISESTHPRTESTIRECMTGFNATLSQLNRSLASINVDKGEKTLTEEKINDLRRMIGGAVADHRRSFYRFEAMVSNEARTKAQKTMRYMSNSLAILDNIETIRDKFNPIKQLLEFVLEYLFSSWVFGSQYLVLIFLLCMLLRI
ncbi:unnamed protein product [Ilex paraguariensis]|uniref:Pectinesterase inhibitor domain-containing protein n=1 Tax=Ilex paraguariensis TaxID=185542 RepID=A0ABC8SET1_9AQUA